MTKITASFLFAIAPSANRDHVENIVQYWPSLAKKYGVRDVDTPYCLAQIAAETGGFNRLEESLNYTTIARIRAVWPTRFKSDAAAAPYVRQPQKLANFVYGGRYGNTGPNDGWLYRGSGCKQTTFKDNYRAVERATGIPCVASPQLLRAFPAALESALVYWRDRGLSKIVDAGGDIVAKLTKAIQGGTGGLADRRTYTARALKAWGTAGASPLPASTILKHGSTGKAVESLQRQLYALGYVSVGRSDGIYGDATEDAVKQLQRRYGLIADGIAGPNTFAVLAIAKPTDYREPEPLHQPSGLDKFLAWLMGLFRA